jgi:two-component system sensor histidine kinase RegB
MQRITTTGRVNLSHLFWLRNLAIIGQLVTIGVVQTYFGVHLPLPAMLMVIALEIVFNALTWLRVPRARPETNFELLGQLWVDLGAPSALLFLSGGTTNPFVSLYLPSLAIAAAVLPWTLMVWLAAFAVACYAALGFDSVPLNMDNPANLFDYYRTGMWVNFMVSVGLIAWFVARMSNALRQRDAALGEAQTHLLRDERGRARRAGRHRRARDGHAAVDHRDADRGAARRGACRPGARALRGRPEGAGRTDDALHVGARAAAQSGERAGEPSAGRRLARHVRRALAPAASARAVRAARRAPVGRRARRHGRGRPDPDDPARQRGAGEPAARDAGREAHASRPRGRPDRIRSMRRWPGIPAALRESLGSMPVDSTQGGHGVGLYLAFSAAARLGGDIELSDVTPRAAGNGRAGGAHPQPAAAAGQRLDERALERMAAAGRGTRAVRLPVARITAPAASNQHVDGETT